MLCISNLFFFFATATTEIYTLSLHDALPICTARAFACVVTHHAAAPRPSTPTPATAHMAVRLEPGAVAAGVLDRKSTRLNSSHSQISYAVFCLKKKKHAGAGGHLNPDLRPNP